MIRRWIDQFFLTPSDGRALSALRIAVGLAVFCEALLLFPYIDALYGQYGYLQSHLMDAVAGITLPSLFARLGVGNAAYSKILLGLYLVHMFSALAFALGWRTRAMNIISLITQILVINSGWSSSYGVDRYLHNLTFLMLFFSVGEHFSIDSRISGRIPEPSGKFTLGTRLVQLFLLMTYIDAGFSKAGGTDWWNGDAVWRALLAQEFNRFDVHWLANYPWILLFLCWSTIIFEGFYFIGYWIPYVGRAWVFAIIGMHLGIAFAMKLTLFGLAMAAVNASVFLIPLHPKKGRPDNGK